MQSQLQDHLARLRGGEPIVPLLPGQAVYQAKRLREAGLTYGAVAQVMALYHGAVKTEAGWQSQLRRMGVPPKHYASRLRTTPRQRAAQR